MVSTEPFPDLAAQATPTHESDAPMLAESSPWRPTYDEPLYTEINIPLPRIRPQTAAAPESSPVTTSSQTPLPKTRSRARTLSSLSPFGRSRSSSSPSQSSDENTRHSEEWPRVRRDIVKNREVAVAMNLNHQSKRTRNSTIDALAVVPAVLVLSAELFTPGSGERKESKRKDSGVGRWEDGIR